MLFSFAAADVVPGKNVVIIGTSFIGTFVELNLMLLNFISPVLSTHYHISVTSGMELASNFSDKAASVTCVGRSSIPFANVLGEKIGTMLKKVQVLPHSTRSAIIFVSPKQSMSLTYYLV